IVQKVCYIYSCPISLCDIDLFGNKNISQKSGFKKPYLSWTAVDKHKTKILHSMVIIKEIKECKTSA
ncbi:MAG: hypothetical protein KA785_09690, partial [Spirochaetaceae bacterium]|nr:hypothetical protein [Spirochaetaceae bacterium]